MASNQVKHNIEMASKMAQALSASSGTLGKEINASIENATKEMIASAEKTRSKMLKEMMDSLEIMKMSFSPSKTRSK